MKTYVGDRTIDGIVVTVDGEPLDERINERVYSRNGFEWSYEGSEASQLAYALLADHMGDPERAAALQERFMRDVVANFNNDWKMTTSDMDRVLRAYG